MKIKYINKEVQNKTLADIEEGVPFMVDCRFNSDPSKLSLFEEIAFDTYEGAILMKIKSQGDARGFDTFYVVNVINGIFHLYNQTEDFSSYNEIVDEDEYVEGVLFPANLPIIPVKATLVVER